MVDCLISLVSRQVWPQILVASHLRPRRLRLLHSADARESKQPARRLDRFFRRTGILGDVRITTHCLPHDDTSKARRALDVAAKDTGCVVNLTGGNKLMAMAAMQWAQQHGFRACYLEKGLKLIWLETADGALSSRVEEIDRHMLDAIDPLHLVRCQIGSSDVEREGQVLALNDKGRSLDCDEIPNFLINRGNPEDLLDVTGHADEESKKGDRLEFASTLAILALGVPMVRRSLRLKTKAAEGLPVRRPHGEIDLVFNFGGQLWIVDCKDRASHDWVVQRLEKELPETPGKKEAVDIVRNALNQSEYKALKDDLLAATETGGLTGRIICVRRTALDPVSRRFAELNNVDLASADDLVGSLRPVLQANRPASESDVASLVAALNSASAL